ncbi:uncharacterized protein LOC143208761 [Lasioglossum baleicum]|uniref:uncharacterized protein LOC143208761 n=1 Tax=Lasioglossum baleicum TaxID=434251 RepID=UPI003FCE3EB7
MSNEIDSMVRRSIPCYFCNEFLDQRHLFDHVKHCGSVLMECPHRCGVYVPRKTMEDHRRSCDKNSSMRHSRIREAQDSLWRNKVFSALTLLRSAIYNEEKERNDLQDKLNRCIDLLRSQQESIDTLRLEIHETRHDAALEERLNRLEICCDNMEHRNNLSFQQISHQLRLLHDDLIHEQDERDRAQSNWSTELNDFRSFLTQEKLETSEAWQEQRQLIHDLKLELEMRCKISNESTERQNLLTEKVDVLDAEARVQKATLAEQKTIVKGLKFQAKENLEYLEELIKEYQKCSSIEVTKLTECPCDHDREYSGRFPTNGRLLWRIDRYKEKMSEAKESEAVLYSPRFSNKEYGYDLRVELFLNGLGKWKGRHIIGCLRVEKGEWDPLLDWPCILRAAVTLRNQEDPAKDVKKLVKAVGRGKTDLESVNRESGIYMFVPHTTLTRYSGYVKDNAMFLDIHVTDIRTASTQSLVA